MPKRSLRIVKRLGTSPAIGVCEYCGKQFKVPMTYLANTANAQAFLQEQFDKHKCKALDSSQNALRVVREATEDK